MKLKKQALAVLGSLAGLLTLLGMSGRKSKPVSPPLPRPGRIRDHLEGVDARLLSVLREVRSMGGSFVVVDGVRTPEEQRAAREGGASRFVSGDDAAPHVQGRAVDVWAIPDKASWQAYVDLARLFARASRKLGVAIRWGGSWAVLDPDRDPAKQAYDYAARKRAEGKQPFVDSGHFEVVG